MNASKKERGRPKDNVWDHYEQGERNSQGHASATCKYCSMKYNRGEMTILKTHLANHCKEAPGSVIRVFQNNFEEKAKKKRKIGNQSTLDEYHDMDQPLPQGKKDRIDKALTRFFVCCGVPFRIVESPFFIDFLQEVNSAYDPPSRDILTNRLLEEELGYVNNKISKELEVSRDLTLGIFILYLKIYYLFISNIKD
jgi:hypothetical protein